MKPQRDGHLARLLRQMPRLLEMRQALSQVLQRVVVPLGFFVGTDELVEQARWRRLAEV